MEYVKENRIIVIVSTLFVFLFLWLNVSKISFIKNIRMALESPFIESRVLINRTPWNKNKSDIVIIDIDRRSLEQIGPWPWSGKHLKLLTNKIINSGASIIAFDLVFNKKSRNSALEVYQQYSNLKKINSVVLKSLSRLIKQFDNDAQFATRIKDHEVITGFLYHKKILASSGYLPPPLPIKNKVQHRSIIKAENFNGNIRVIQKASKFGGFININVDSDGIFRRTPLIIQYGYSLYPALALQIARVQQVTKKLSISFDENDSSNLRTINIDEVKVPVEANLKVMLTYRGPAGSFPKYSAIDLITDKFDLSRLERKTVIIGSSEPHIRPLINTLAGKHFSSAEIHANLLSGILTDQLLTRPNWIKSLDNFLILLIGIILSALLPFLKVKNILILTAIASVFWLAYNYWMYTSAFIISSISVPLLMILIISSLNLVSKYDPLRFRVVSAIAHLQYKLKLKKKISDRDNMEDTSIEETATVMLVDIRNFSGLSEKLEGIRLNRLVNSIIGPITNIIESHNGELSQHIGHRLMASWRAGNALDAVKASHKIISSCKELKPKLKQKGLPEIQVNIGIHTGKVRYKTLSFNSSIVYGQPVNIATSLADLNQFYKVNCLVGEKTISECGDYIFRAIDYYTPPKSSSSLKIYEPIIDLDQMDVIRFYEIQHYESALEFLKENKLNEANNLFQYLLELNPDQFLYQLYVNRIEELKISSDGLIWQGPLNRRQ